MPQRILTALADLAPARVERPLDVTGSQPITWLTRIDKASAATADRLAALDALHRDERLLRRGWAWLIGGVTVDGKRRPVRLPLLSQPVRLQREGGGYRVVAAGDVELISLVEDRTLAAQLEAAPGIGSPGWEHAPGTAAWIKTVAEAAGLPYGRLAGADESAKLDRDDELVAFARVGLYLVRDVNAVGLQDTLRTWAGRDGLAMTALARVYGLAAPVLSTEDDSPIRSPMPLSPAQREVVTRARREPLVVVSGPPGNGKSHAVVAAALDTVDRGGSVLVATQSTHAAEVLAELLARYPGPAPVLFGDAERRDAIATELGTGMVAGTGDAELRAAAAAVQAAAAKVRAVVAGITAALETERTAATLSGWQPLLAGMRVDAPGAFEPDFDVAAARRDAERAAGPATGWWQRFRRWHAQRRYRSALGASPLVPEDRLTAIVDAAHAAQATAQLAAAGGTDLGPAWAALAAADGALASAAGAAMRQRATSEQRWTEAGRRSASALGGALRAGRNRRRQLLAGLDGPALVQALPLWIGTVNDVEDLLPPTPSLFDLVVLDEAAHIDQIRAAPVLARAERALVVGDPRQLRFVSFVADVDVAVTLARHGLESFGDRLDVRRNSAFDVAAGAAPVTYLDEHYRSAPHLIEFSARRFYAGRIALMTRHPRNEDADVIEVVRVLDGAVDDGVNAAEVAAVIDVVRKLARDGAVGIGVVTPFRPQADALEAALLAEFPVEEIERLGLRVGTVHAFQGSEADTVVASLGLVDGDSSARQRFASDANLFNVLVTRARQRMIVVTSLTEGSGVVSEYLAYSAAPPPLPVSAATGDGWAARLAGELRAAGSPVRVDYPVGRWTVDLCVGQGAEAIGLVCGVHRDGPQAHIERQRALARAGWTLRDAFASRWSSDPIRAAIEL